MGLWFTMEMAMNAHKRIRHRIRDGEYSNIIRLYGFYLYNTDTHTHNSFTFSESNNSAESNVAGNYEINASKRDLMKNAVFGGFHYILFILKWSCSHG